MNILRAWWCRFRHRKGWRVVERYDGERVYVCARCLLEFPA